VSACDAAYLGGPSKRREPVILRLTVSNTEKPQHSAVQTAPFQGMIERIWHVIAGISSRWCAGAALRNAWVLLQLADFVRHFCSFDIAKFVCVVRVAYAHCELPVRLKWHGMRRW